MKFQTKVFLLNVKEGQQQRIQPWNPTHVSNQWYKYKVKLIWEGKNKRQRKKPEQQQQQQLFFLCFLLRFVLKGFTPDGRDLSDKETKALLAAGDKDGDGKIGADGM